MGEKEEQRAKEMTLRQNVILNELRGKKATLSDIKKTMEKSKAYKGFSSSQIDSEAPEAAQR